MPAGGVTVVAAPGIYSLAAPLELQAQDSGTEQSPIVYRAAQRGTAVISGGIAMSEWQLVSDPEILKRLDPAARGAVVWTNVDRVLIDELPGFSNGGCGFVGKPEYPVALYQDQQRLPIARWPNEGFVTMGECLGNSVIAGTRGAQVHRWHLPLR